MAAGVVALLCVRVVAGGTGAYDRGMAALESGDELLAGLELREAITWYLPVAPWRGSAAEALWSLHEAQLRRGEVQAAVSTLTLLRAGYMGSRTLFGVDPWKDRADAALAPLMARWESELGQAEGRDTGALAERQAFFASKLAEDPLPAAGWGLLGVLGFAGWVAGMLIGVRREGRGRWVVLAAAAICFAAFLGGIALA